MKHYKRPKVPSSNRGNDLLISTLKSRYPYIVNDDTIPFIRTWLSAKSDLDRSRILNAYSSSDCEKYLSDYVKKFKPSYPIQLGKENIVIFEFLLFFVVVNSIIV